MNRFVLPFPVAPGKTDADARSIAAYFKSHPAEYHASRARHGVSLERAYLQPTPMGSVVISYAVPVTYTLTYAASSGGTVSGSTPQTVVSGGSGTAGPGGSSPRCS